MLEGRADGEADEIEVEDDGFGICDEGVEEKETPLLMDGSVSVGGRGRRVTRKQHRAASSHSSEVA